MGLYAIYWKSGKFLIYSCNQSGELVIDLIVYFSLYVLQWTDLFKAFLIEAEWHYSGYKPSLEEYLNNGWISVSGHVVMVYVFLLSEQEKTKVALKHLMDYPNLIKSSSMIFRLCNDIATSAVSMR